MAEHDDEPRLELLGRELDAADLRRRDDVARDANHKQVSEALIEHDLGRDARIGATEDDRERLLPLRDLLAARRAGAAVALALRHEPPVAVAQGLERFPR